MDKRVYTLVQDDKTFKREGNTTLIFGKSVKTHHPNRR